MLEQRMTIYKRNQHCANKDQRASAPSCQQPKHRAPCASQGLKVPPYAPSWFQGCLGQTLKLKHKKRGRKTEARSKLHWNQGEGSERTRCMVAPHSLHCHDHRRAACEGSVRHVSGNKLCWPGLLQPHPQKRPLSPTKPFQGWEAKTSKSLPSCHCHLFVGLLLHIPYECREIIKDASARKIRSQKPDMIDDRAWGNQQKLSKSTKKTQVPLTKGVQKSAEKLPGWRRNVTSPAGHVVEVDRIPSGTAMKNPMPQTTTPPNSWSANSYHSWKFKHWMLYKKARILDFKWSLPWHYFPDILFRQYIWQFIRHRFRHPISTTHFA